MKATRIVRNMDELGRVVIPMELRRTMELDPGTPLEIFVESGSILLRKYNPGCILCGGTDNLAYIDGKTPVCRKCAEKIGAQAGRG